LLDNFKEIIARLEEQKRAIDQAIATLSEFDEAGVPKSSTPMAKRSGMGLTKATKKRVMSEEGRQRIAEAQKKRWATKKRAAKKLAKAA
jgi:hypothetical protein